MADTSQNAQWNALKKIVKRLPAHLAYYGSALGAIAIAGSGAEGMVSIVGNIGAGLLGNLIADIAKGEDVMDEDIRHRAEDAIHKSDIANLLTKQDFLQGYARLIQRLDAQKTISQDILDELRTGFSKVASADQVEELKRLILQLMQQSPQTATRKARLFISYARADDEPFVERLYHDLKDEFEVWWDRVSMPNRGLTFLQEIRDAIDWADRLLLVAGPRAFTSDYVRDEWQYAYETYKGINITLRLGDYTNFPAQLSGFDAPDFRRDDDYDERLATLKRQLAEPVAPKGEFHGVPALPPHFLNRPDALDALRELVIADVDKPTLISAEKRITAVEGMGGIGKSVMATAFAHDRKVRFAFPDGIVWLTVGRDAKLYELYRAVGVALGDDLSNYPDETTARQNAQKALADKKCLLILDDVWELQVGRAFRDLISGTAARLLITTRNLQINDVLNANEYRLKLIDESQASDYLRGWVGDDPDLETIAEKLGYLFLALKLAGARMKKDGLSGADYLRTFDRVSRMKIDRQASDREDSLEASITLSVDAAFANAEDEKLLYHTFGIFPEDTPVPQQTILQLWWHLRPDVDEFDLLETLNALVDLALVERNADDRTITLHDLLHSYTREKLGDRYVQTHQDLLDSYGVERWHELAQDEPYLWWHIAYHLMKAQKENILKDMLLSHQFLRSKLLSTDVNFLISDYTYFSGDPLVDTLKSAIEMSAHILWHDNSGLAHQLIGRLMSQYHQDKDISALVDGLKEDVPAILPIDLNTPYHTHLQAGGALIRRLEGHTRRVIGAMELSNGRILSWSGDKTLRLWTLDGKPLAVLEGHTKSVTQALELPNGNIVSWANGDFFTDNQYDLIHVYDTLRLWSSDGIALGPLGGKRYMWRWDTVGGKVLSDGRILAWGGIDDQEIRMWSMDGNFVKALQGHTGRVYGVIELRNNSLVSWGQDKSVRLWSYDGTPIGSLEDHPDEIYNVKELSNNNLLTVGKDNIIRIWSIAGEFIASLKGHADHLSGVIELSDGRLMSWSGWEDEKEMRIWSSIGNLESKIQLDHRISEIIELPSGHLLSWTGNSGSFGLPADFRLWSENGNLLKRLEGHTGSIRGALVLPDRKILSWSEDGTLRMWDAEGESLSVLEGHEEGLTGALALSSNNVISWGGDRNLNIWDIKRTTINSHYAHQKAVGSVKALPNGKILTQSAWTKYNDLFIWNQDGTLHKTIKPIQDGITDTFIINSNLILSRNRHNTTSQLWTLDGDHMRTIEGKTLLLSDNRILSWQADNLFIWEHDGSSSIQLSSHKDTVVGARENINESIISWSNDNTLRLWDRDGRLLQILAEHRGKITGVDITGMGNILAWSEDGVLMIWDMAGNLIHRLDDKIKDKRRVKTLQNGNFITWAYEDRNATLYSVDGQRLGEFQTRFGCQHVEQLSEDRIIAHTGGGGDFGFEPIIHLYNASGELIETLVRAWRIWNLTDNRIVTWSSRISQFRLWSGDGKQLSQLDEHLSGSKYRIISWANSHDFDALELFAHEPKLQNYRLGLNRTKLYIYDPNTGETIASFYGDADFEAGPIVTNDNIIVLGDAVGRVLFLCFRGGGTHNR